MDRLDRVEDISFEWIFQAEKIWKVNTWAIVFYKMSQITGETLLRDEVEALKVCGREKKMCLFTFVYFKETF